MSTITVEQQAAIAKMLEGMHLPMGLGDEHSDCSIAAINLALSGELKDSIPDCMSEVIGKWIIVVQDAMPDAMRNSQEWKSLLPLAAGTGRDDEQERLDIILDWMWGTVLPSVQRMADWQGFGQQWQQMTTERTVESAEAAERESWAAWAWSARAVWEAWEASQTARAAWEAARAVWAAERASWAAMAAARAMVWAGAKGRASWAAWANFDPCGLLERLIRIDSNAQETV